MSLILIGILALAFYLGAVSMLVFKLQPPLTPTSNVSSKTPTVSIMLYVGENANSQPGFGTSPNNLTSPGPTLRFKFTDIVSVTVVNVGKMPHAFATTAMPKTGATLLFNAEVGSASNPLEPAQRGTVVFAPGNAGTFYYICPVPGHAELGMYGAVVVTG